MLDGMAEGVDASRGMESRLGRVHGTRCGTAGGDCADTVDAIGSAAWKSTSDTANRKRHDYTRVNGSRKFERNWFGLRKGHAVLQNGTLNQRSVRRCTRCRRITFGLKLLERDGSKSWMSAEARGSILYEMGGQTEWRTPWPFPWIDNCIVR
jgi:hypothetical protein